MHAAKNILGYDAVRRDALRVWMAVAISLATAGYWLLVHLSDRIREFMLPFTSLPIIDWCANGVYLWLVVLLWMANRRWRTSLMLERELTMAVNSIGPEVLITVSHDGTITACSETVRDMFGHDPKDILGRHTEVLYDDRRPDADPGQIRDAVDRAGFHLGQATGRKKSGEAFPLEITTAGLRGGRGAILLIHDISERKRMEQAVLNAYGELEQRVEERTSKLRRANEELIRARQRLGDLVAELSSAEERERRRIALNLHDSVGQTLALCKMKLGALSREAESRTGPALHELLEYIEDAIRETRSLTGQLSPPALYELGIDPALEWLAENIEQRYRIPVTFSSDGKTKDADETTRVVLFQAARELVLNAVKHASAGLIKVSSRRTLDGIELSVEDDGVGFDEKGGNPTDARDGGFGLFHIRERLAAMGGRLDIVSRRGDGTRATLTAPLTTQTPENGGIRR